MLCRVRLLIRYSGFGGGSWADEVEETYGESDTHAVAC